jgi:predicted rRNA methylase YqxC with S4 and FtsJ domains
VQEEAVAGIAALTAAHGFGLIGVTASPISGGDGNREFLLAARRLVLPSPRSDGEKVPRRGG